MLLVAQSAPGAGTPAEHLDRVRAALAAPPAITVPARPAVTRRPVFRVKVEAWTFTYKPWEEPRKGVPSYVRPGMPLAHYEYLNMVTPEAFRASTLYPGISIDPGTLLQALFKRDRAAAERRARDEVRRDFQAYLRARDGER
jgi:hypothetical protein